MHMSRPPNTQKSLALNLKVTPQVLEHLKAMVELGMYGKTPTEVATNLVYRGVEALIEKGHLQHGRPKRMIRSSR